MDFTWNPVFREIMRLKKSYISTVGPTKDIYDATGYKTCVDKWIEKTQDSFWSDVRPFLIIKQYKTAILFKYGNLAVLSDLAEEKGMTTTDQLWNAWDGFLQSCRSITIDVKKETIITCPFDKFFNVGELESTSWDVVKRLMEKAVNIEFSNKLDGSICIARYIGENEFFITTSGSLDDSDEQATVLRDVKKVFYAPENANLREFVKEFREYPCMFEYSAVDNRIVVKYSKAEEGLYLIGLRYNGNGILAPYGILRSLAKEKMIKVTSVFKGSLDEVMEIIKTKKSDEMEGFVINIDGHLFKLKTDDYVKVHKIISKLSAPNVLIRAIADGVYDDLLAKVPETFKADIQKIAAIIYDFENFNQKLTQGYYEMAPKEERKNFMIWVENSVPNNLKGAVRNVYLGKPNNFLKKERGKGVYQYTKMSQIDPDIYNNINSWGGEE